MKKLLVLLFIPLTIYVSAQSEKDDAEKGGFKKEKLFTGGSVTAGFSNYSSVLGISPQLGYSLTNWLDAGIAINFNYSSQKDYETYGENKIRQTVYGPAVFVRVFPVNFLFMSAQYEYNLIHEKYIPAEGSYTTTENYNTNANSLLLGAGYAGGRERGNNTYYYFSISWDVLGDKNSPYLDGYGNMSPIIRAGYNIGLFQGRRNRF